MLDGSDIDATAISTWQRPSKVTLTEGLLECDFGSHGLYALQESYARSPHALFLNARSDEEMRSFVQSWGPLYLRHDERGKKQITHSLAEYQSFRRQFEATLALMEAVERGSGERECLKEFVNAAIAYDASLAGPDFPLEAEPSFGDMYFENEESCAQWVMQAPIRDVRKAVDYSIGAFATPPKPLLKVIRQGRKSSVIPHWSFRDLMEAIRWMLWNDVSRGDPLYRCQECKRYFRPETKRQRKFCTGSNCAAKATKRNWRRRDLAKKKQEKEARKVKGE